MIPINIQQHCTTVIVDIWSKRIFHYDPMVKRFQNETAIKLFKVFFDMLYKYCKTCEIQIGSKGFLKDFAMTWEETFPCQQDTCSCAVFILMYMSHHLGFLTFDPAGQNISSIQNEMAEELFLGMKTQPVMGIAKIEQHPKDVLLQLGTNSIWESVVLYCSTSEGAGKKFKWTFNSIAVYPTNRNTSLCCVLWLSCAI